MQPEQNRRITNNQGRGMKRSEIAPFSDLQREKRKEKNQDEQTKNIQEGKT